MTQARYRNRKDTSAEQNGSALLLFENIIFFYFNVPVFILFFPHVFLPGFSVLGEITSIAAVFL